MHAVPIPERHGTRAYKNSVLPHELNLLNFFAYEKCDEFRREKSDIRFLTINFLFGYSTLKNKTKIYDAVYMLNHYHHLIEEHKFVTKDSLNYKIIIATML